MTDDVKQALPTLGLAIVGLALTAIVAIVMFSNGMRAAKDVVAAAGIFTTITGTLVGTFRGVHVAAGDPAYDLAAVWLLLPGDATSHFHAAYRPTPDTATLRRARGWAMARALGGILIGDAGVHGRPGGKPTWGPPAHTALQHLTATIR